MLLKLSPSYKLFKKQKNRKKKSFKLFYKSNHSIISLNSYKLFTNHLKLLNLLINKISLKKRKISKKDKFKKITDGILRRKFLNKNMLYYKNINNLADHLQKNKIILKKYQKFIKSFLYINLPFNLSTKKSIGSRMGKGKGSNSNYYLKIPAGFPLLILLNWPYSILKYLTKFLIYILPNKNCYSFSLNMFFLKKNDIKVYKWMKDWTILLNVDQYNNWIEKKNYNVFYLEYKLNVLLFLNKNFFSWYKKKIFWQFFFSGFYFDDLFSKSIKSIFNRFMILPAFYILDKWLSYWTGGGITNYILNSFNKIFYFEKINYFFFLYILLICILLLYFLIYLFFYFLI